MKLKKKNKDQLILWGNGKALREVIYVDDLADACIFFMKKKIKEPIVNIGTGKDFSIKVYAEKILKEILPKKKILIKYDYSKPNGTPRKILDITLAKSYGWRPKTSLKDAIRKTYKDFLSKKEK